MRCHLRECPPCFGTAVSGVMRMKTDGSKKPPGILFRQVDSTLGALPVSAGDNNTLHPFQSGPLQHLF